MSRDLEREITELKAELRETSRVLVGVQNYLRIAANYKNEDIDSRVDGLQFALEQASKVEAKRARRQNGHKGNV